MNRRFLSSLLCVSAIGSQLLNAQAPVVATPADNANVQAPVSADALSQLRARIAEQQEQIKKLQQAVDQQQKMLEQTLANSNAASANRTTTDGTPVVTAANESTAPAKLVPAVNTGRPDIVNLPRSMQDSEPKASPLSVSIGNATFTPFGFIDFFAFGRSSNAGSGIGSSFPSIPYNNSITDHISEFNQSMQNSRLGFRIDSKFKGFDVLGYFEMDFLGNQPTGIFQTSNSDVFRMRNVFLDTKKDKLEILVGQDWSMATPTRKGLSPIPSDIFYSQAVDTNYLDALVWARQAQVRLMVHPNDNVTMGISFENPQQFIGGGVTLPAAYATQLATQLNNGATTYTAPNLFPDIIFKVAADSKFFHVDAGGIIREFKVATSAGAPVIYSAHSATGYVGQANFMVSPTSKFHLFAQTYFGEGGGRYIGGDGPDLIVRSDGSISPVHSYATTDGFEANLTKSLMLYSYYSGAEFRKDVALDANGKTLIGYGFTGSGLTNNKTLQEFTFGLWPTFWKNPTYGAVSMNLQYSYVFRDPWYVPAAGPKDAHLNLWYIDVRYTIP